MRFTRDRWDGLTVDGRLRRCCVCGGEFVLEGSGDRERRCPDHRPELAGELLEDTAEHMAADPERRLREAVTR